MTLPVPVTFILLVKAFLLGDMDIDFFVCKAEDVDFPDEYLEYFNLVSQEEFRVDVLFTREAWHGRMRACRGVGASMSSEELMKWDEEIGKCL